MTGEFLLLLIFAVHIPENILKTIPVILPTSKILTQAPKLYVEAVTFNGQ